MPVMLSISPILTLIAGAGLVWVLHARQYRNAWIAALAVCIIAWVAMLLLGLLPPAAFDLSVDMGTFSLQFDYDFVLDDMGWELGLTAITILLALLFMEIGQSRGTLASEQPVLLVLGAIAALSMMSASLLSTTLTWTAFDLAQLIYASQGEERGGMARWPRAGVSLILIRAGLLMGAIAFGGGTRVGEDGFASLGSPIAWLLFLGAIYSRAWGPTPSTFGNAAQKERRWGLEFGLLISVALALFPLARALAANQVEPVLGLIKWTGLIGLLLGGVGFALVEDLEEGGAYYSLGLIGLGILLGSLGGAGTSVPVHIGVLGTAIASIARGSGPFAKWERSLLWIAGGVFAGLPPFIGMAGAGALGDEWRAGGDMLAAGLGSIGYAALLSGLLRRTRKKRSEWPISEELSRVFFAIGLGLPLLPLLGFGLQYIGDISVPGALNAVGIFLVGLGIADLSLRLKVFEYGRDLAALGARGWRVLGRAVGGVFGSVRVGVLAILDVLEGEGAVIWLFVILLFLGLLMRGVTA